VERANQTIKKVIAKFLNEKKDWDDLLPYACLSVNSQMHEATKYSPFFLVFGRHAILKGDLNFPTLNPNPDLSPEEQADWHKQHIANARDNLISCQNKRAEKFNATHKPCTLKKGDYVLYKTPKKLRVFEDPWTGPFEIIKPLQNGSFYIQNLELKNVILRATPVQLKLYSKERNKSILSSISSQCSDSSSFSNIVFRPQTRLHSKPNPLLPVDNISAPKQLTPPVPHSVSENSDPSNNPNSLDNNPPSEIEIVPILETLSHSPSPSVSRRSSIPVRIDSPKSNSPSSSISSEHWDVVRPPRKNTKAYLPSSSPSSSPSSAPTKIPTPKPKKLRKEVEQTDMFKYLLGSKKVGKSSVSSSSVSSDPKARVLRNRTLKR
jgi:hypothetical protein